MKYDTRKAGDRFKEDDSPATQHAAEMVKQASDAENYEQGGKYNSGTRIGERKASVDTGFTDRLKSGEYDVDNSTTANLNRTRKQINSYRDGAEAYRDTSHIAQGAIDRADKNRYINTQAIDERIGAREMYNKAQSDVTRSEIFGDVWHDSNQFINEDARKNWQTPDEAEEPEAIDWEDMYNKYSNFDN